MSYSLQELSHTLLPLFSNFERPMHELSLLIRHVCGCTQEELIAHPETIVISQKDFIFITKLAKKRANGMPLAYLTGNKEFYGRNFIVSPDVLIPRPETELLIDITLSYIMRIIQKNPPFDNAISHNIFDCGTGSGCIGITLMAEIARRYPCESASWSCVLTDVSAQALKIAQKNAKALLPHNAPLTFMEQSLLSSSENILQSTDTTPIGILVANLPYVANNHMNMINLPCEPRVALEGVPNTYKVSAHKASTNKGGERDDGLALIAELFTQAGTLSHPHILLLEADPLQFDALSELAYQQGYPTQHIYRDIRTYPRVFVAISF